MNEQYCSFRKDQGFAGHFSSRAFANCLQGDKGPYHTMCNNMIEMYESGSILLRVALHIVNRYWIPYHWWTADCCQNIWFKKEFWLDNCGNSLTKQHLANQPLHRINIGQVTQLFAIVYLVTPSSLYIATTFMVQNVQCDYRNTIA